MSYASLIKSVPETLSQPTGIAALVSLGIHGALGFILPILPFDSTPVEPQQQKTVGVVQLTPTEQNRLPQSFQPQATLPFFATQQSFLPTLPPAPYFPPNTSATLLFPSFKTPVNKYPPIYSFPRTQAFRRSPLTQSRNSQPSSQTFSFGKTPISASRQTVRTYDIAKLSDIMSGLAPAPVPEELKSYRVSPTPENFNQPIPTPSDNQPTPTPADNQPNPTSADNQQAAVNNSEANQSFMPNQQHQGFEAMKQEIRNRRREQPAANSDGSVPSAAAQWRADAQAWYARHSRVREEYRDVDTKPPIYEKLSTSQKELSGGVAVLGVVVNTEGKILSKPEFIGQPSVPGIEQEAIDHVTKYPFPATRKITNYQFRLEFKYEADNANATPESAPESAEAPKPSPTSEVNPRL